MRSSGKNPSVKAAKDLSSGSWSRETFANTRANAAVAFTRHKSLKAVPVLRDVLKSAAALKQAGPSGDVAPVAATNAMKAIGELAPLLDESTRSEITNDIATISKDYPEPRVRLDAAQTLMKLRASP